MHGAPAVEGGRQRGDAPEPADQQHHVRAERAVLDPAAGRDVEHRLDERRDARGVAAQQQPLELAVRAGEGRRRRGAPAELDVGRQLAPARLEPVDALAGDRALVAGDRPGGVHAGDHRRLDAAAVHAVAGPVAGELEVGEAGVAGGQPVLHRPGRREHVALPGRRVGAPVLGVEAGRARAAVAVHEHAPVERAGRACVRPQHPQVALDELDRVLLGAVGRLGVGLARAVVEHAAEVADRLRSVGRQPGLAREQVGHVAERVERLDVAARHRVLVELPAQLARVAIGPELERLGADGHGRLDAAPEALVACHQLAAQVGQGPHRDAQHHLVEVAAALERARGAPERVQLGLEVDPLRRGLELLPVRLARPARQPLDGNERVVALDVLGQLDLADDLDRVDAVAAGVQSGDRVEELEAHAAPQEHLVERGEDDVAHPRLHLVHDRAAVAEGESEQVAGGGAGGAVGGVDVAAGVGEGHVVDGPQGGGALGRRAPDRHLAGAVAAQPDGPVLAVDHVEAVLEDAVLDDAGDRGDARVDDREEEAQVGVVPIAAGDDGRPEPLPERLEQAHEQQRLGGVLGDRVVGVPGAERRRGARPARAGARRRRTAARAGRRRGRRPGSRTSRGSGRGGRRPEGDRRAGRAGSASRRAQSGRRWRRSPRRWAARRGRPGAGCCAGSRSAARASRPPGGRRGSARRSP